MERSTIVRVHEGLHARPATRFVKLAKGFVSEIEIVRDGKAASAKSSVKLMLLAVKENQEVTVRANGADAAEAIEALIGYLENPRAGLDDESAPEAYEMPEPAKTHSSTNANALKDSGVEELSGRLRGIAASEGVAIGRAFAHFPREIRPQPHTLPAEGIPAEIERLHDAVAKVRDRMAKALADATLAETDRAIVAALMDIAADEDLIGRAERWIRQGMDAVSAVIGATDETAAEFRAVEDSYLAARTDDINAVGRQIALALLGEEEADLSGVPEGAVLIADDIGAWDLARAPLKRIGGVVCGKGGATSHIAIIARSHGIPAVLGLGERVRELAQATEVALDGSKGWVVGDPDEATRKEIISLAEEAATERTALAAFRDMIPKRPDGTIIEIAANLGSLEEIDPAREAGAMGVGLFRTELLFMRHTHLPSEDLQAETYSTLAKAFAPWPVIIRTLDVGGDKPVAGIEFPQEENPFLGWRGIRMCLDRPEIFKTQLKALLRAAVHGNVKVMLPMVSEIAEVERTKVLIEECSTELAASGTPFARFDLGVMIETPAAVLIASELARHVAFFSIGTNDLTQYIMAADRLQPEVAHLNDVANPAVMAAIKMTARAGTEAGIMVGMCGEAAGRPDLIPRFVDMGVTELSMSPSSIQRAKKTVSELSAELS
ncbi:MAG: phosphoenolpyruvate--protein phosphotransferase [Rhizobiaceae bacterium]|nr:phosphoenolpyruvate--protein phosphotransferase [Rhizobiaceae bacterium]